MGAGAMSATSLLNYAFLAQMLYAGVSSALRVRAMRQDNVDMCAHNRALSRQSSVLRECLLRGVQDQGAIAQLKELVSDWEGSAVAMEQWAGTLSARFLQHYVVFLFFLGLVSVLLFFVIAKKAVRLAELFSRIRLLGAKS